MTGPDDKKSEATKPPDSPERVTAETGVILDELKRKMKEIDDDPKTTDKNEAKKAHIRERLAVLTEVQVEALKAQIDRTPELVNALVGIRELVEEKRNALKAQVEAQRAAAEKKPEGVMAGVGGALTTAATTIGEWGQWLWGKTSTGAGIGFDKFMEGMKAVGDGFMKLWEMVKGPLNKARESIAIALGSVVISLEKILPTAVTETFNAIVGNVGVFYATLNRLGVKIVADAAGAANATIEEFNRIYEQMVAWGRTTLDFPGFIREVAGRLRDQKGSLAFTLADMIRTANIISGEKPPATPAVAPGATPAVPGAAPAVASTAPAAVPEDASKVFTLDTVPPGTNLLGVARKLMFDGKTLTILASTDGTFQIDAVKYKLRVKKQIPIWGEELFSPSVNKLEWKQGGLDCSGSWFGIKQNQVIERKVLENFLQKHLSGETRIDTPKILLEKIS